MNDSFLSLLLMSVEEQNEAGRSYRRFPAGKIGIVSKQSYLNKLR